MEKENHKKHLNSRFKSKTLKKSRKTAQLKAHHARPYRKRHYALLIISLLAAVVLVVYVVQYHAQLNSNIDSAKSYLENNLNKQETILSNQTINSTYGFAVTYNPNQYYAAGVDASSGQLYIGSQLSTSRPYKEIRFSGTKEDTQPNDADLNLTYYDTISATGSNSLLTNLENNLVAQARAAQGEVFVKQSSDTVTLSRVTFLKTNWTKQVSVGSIKNLNIYNTTYVGIVNGKPLVITANYGVSDTPAPVNSDIDSIINSLAINSTQAVAKQKTIQSVSVTNGSPSLLDNLLLTGQANAASPDSVNSAELISSTYSPAVVEIINAYCMDIAVGGQPYLKNACNAVQGSGFFVSSDGFIASNGHVVSANPKDLVLASALTDLKNGSETKLDYLLNLAGISPNDPAFVGESASQVLATVVDKLYTDLPNSDIITSNSVSNLLVNLGGTNPDPNAIINDTNARKLFPEQPSLKQAQFVAANYRYLDDLDSTIGFKASDVALIKISGSDYPVTKLGNLSEVSQGSDINILGFPGAADLNGLVDPNHSPVTLTNGIVSGIKDDAGDTGKLIETEAVIGHGNSGGPVFLDNGDVVGIATYTIDGSGSGYGVYNYVRDIGDLTKLASSSSINFDTTSQTQTDWQKGINLYYESHYSAALKYFNQVEKLYPQHPTVDTFITSSENFISHGKDVKNFPTIPVVIGGVIIIIAGSTAVFMIVRHKNLHNLFKKQSSDTEVPLQPGPIPVPVNATPLQVTQQAAPAVTPQVVTPQPVAPQIVQPPAPRVITPQTVVNPNNDKIPPLK